MEFKVKNVYTAANADRIHKRTLAEGLYGYFSDNVESLKKAVERERINRECWYGRLSYVEPPCMMKRFYFGSEDLFFCLFYPTDRKHNKMRY